MFSLYDALGRPDNLTINGSIRSRGEGLVNQFRPAPAARNDYLASFFTNIFAEYNLGTVKIGAEIFDQPRLRRAAKLGGLHHGRGCPPTRPGLS